MNNKIYCSYHYNPQEEHYQLQIETQKYSKEAEKESLKSSEESDSYDPMLDFWICIDNYLYEYYTSPG